MAAGGLFGVLAAVSCDTLRINSGLADAVSVARLKARQASARGIKLSPTRVRATLRIDKAAFAITFS
jgi:hypothetical protein